MAVKRKLETAVATESLFRTATDEAPKKGRKPKQEEPEQAAGTTEPKRDLQTFSVKIDSDVLKRWRTYTTIEKYGETGKLTEAALVEYMNRHKLTGDKLTKFETLIGL